MPIKSYEQVPGKADRPSWDRNRCINLSSTSFSSKTGYNWLVGRYQPRACQFICTYTSTGLLSSSGGQGSVRRLICFLCVHRIPEGSWIDRSLSHVPSSVVSTCNPAVYHVHASNISKSRWCVPGAIYTYLLLLGPKSFGWGVVLSRSSLPNQMSFGMRVLRQEIIRKSRDFTTIWVWI